jgi:hypothetical protein
MGWRRWDNVEAFDAWHAAAMAALDIPRPGRDAATGRFELHAQWTVAYTEAVVMADDDVRALVLDDAEHIAPELIGEPCDAPELP